MLCAYGVPTSLLFRKWCWISFINRFCPGVKSACSRKKKYDAFECMVRGPYTVVRVQHCKKSPTGPTEQINPQPRVSNSSTNLLRGPLVIIYDDPINQLLSDLLGIIEVGAFHLSQHSSETKIHQLWVNRHPQVNIMKVKNWCMLFFSDVHGTWSIIMHDMSSLALLTLGQRAPKIS